MKNYGILIYVEGRDLDIPKGVKAHDVAFSKAEDLLCDEFKGAADLFEPVTYPNGEKCHCIRTVRGYIFIVDFIIKGYKYDYLKQEYKDKLIDLDGGLPFLMSHECPICGTKEKA